MPLLARGSFARAVDGVQKAQKKEPQEGKSKNNKKRKSAEATPRILNILTLDSECSMNIILSKSYVYVAAALNIFKSFCLSQMKAFSIGIKSSYE